MSYQNLQVSIEAPVTLLTINRPTALNALNPLTLYELNQTFTELATTAAEALQIGLVEQVVPAVELLETARAMATEIANKPQIAVQLIRKAVDNGLDMPLDKAIDYEADLFGLCFATHDQKEGMAAFMEKRSALWQNR